MSIVGAFTNPLQNGQLEDATQVMALFSFIQSQVNGNACPATTGSALLKGNGSGGTQTAVAGTDYMAVSPGMVFDYAGGSIPSGYLLCDGSAVSRTTYASLFAAIGTTWGTGDGSTTFNVPSAGGRASIGAGVGTGTTTRTLGTLVGEETHVLTTAELAAHNHVINISESPHTHANTLSDPKHAHNVQGTGGGGSTSGLSGNSGGGALGGTTTDLQPTGITISNAAASTGITATSNNNGSGTAHNNMQPSIVFNKIIKT